MIIIHRRNRHGLLRTRLFLRDLPENIRKKASFLRILFKLEDLQHEKLQGE